MNLDIAKPSLSQGVSVVMDGRMVSLVLFSYF